MLESTFMSLVVGYNRSRGLKGASVLFIINFRCYLLITSRTEEKASFVVANWIWHPKKTPYQAG